MNPTPVQVAIIQSHHLYKPIVETVYSPLPILFPQCGACIPQWPSEPRVFIHFSRCEVQFDYGLRQYRSRPLEARPKSFVSGSGKAISVEKKVAAMNDTITKKGKVGIHAYLLHQAARFSGCPQGSWTWIGFEASTSSYDKSRRTLGVKVRIKLSLSKSVKDDNPKEWSTSSLELKQFSWTVIQWVLVYTLRFLTITKPIQREIPVFGVVHDQIIVGVIVRAFAFRMIFFADDIQDEVKCHIYSNNKADVASDNIPQTHLDDYLICQSYLSMFN
jgi:hypothetical protein